MLKNFSAFGQLADVSEGGQVHSAVLSVLSSSLALLTILHSEEALSTCLVPSETTDLPDTSDLPEIVSSVLKNIMEDEDTSGMYVTNVLISCYDFFPMAKHRLARDIRCN